MLAFWQVIRLLLWPVGKLAFALLLLEWYSGQRVYELERRRRDW